MYCTGRPLQRCAVDAVRPRGHRRPVALVAENSVCLCHHAGAGFEYQRDVGHRDFQRESEVDALPSAARLPGDDERPTRRTRQCSERFLEGGEVVGHAV